MKEIDLTQIDREDFRSLLGEIFEAYMPFGLFGPKSYPPRGVPLTDLPPEYLQWFRERGWPKGRLGELMQAVSDIKAVGGDFIFEPMRQKRGGRMRLQKRRNRTDFSEEE